MKVTINTSIREISIDHAGQTLVFHADRASAENRAYAELHGFKQRIIDAAAVERTDADGKIIPADERSAMQTRNMTAIIEHIESGSTEWNIRASGGTSDGGLLVKAMVRAGATLERATETVKGMTRGQQNAALTHEKLRDHVAAIRAELGKGVDVSGALADLGI